MTYLVTLLDGDIEALMGAIKRDDPLHQNRKLETARRKLQDARTAQQVPRVRPRNTRWGLARLFDGENPLTLQPTSGMRPDVLSRRAHNWASYHKVRVSTRIIDGNVKVWLLGTRHA